MEKSRTTLEINKVLIVFLPHNVCDNCVFPVRNSPNTSVIAMLSMPPPISLLQHKNFVKCKTRDPYESKSILSNMKTRQKNKRTNVFANATRPLPWLASEMRTNTPSRNQGRVV